MPEVPKGVIELEFAFLNREYKLIVSIVEIHVRLADPTVLAQFT